VGRKAQCLNNLRQIGLAIMNYETANKSFPAGAIYFNAGDGPPPMAHPISARGLTPSATSGRLP